jgi:molybdopterin synthase sulfur carrier subunit
MNVNFYANFRQICGGKTAQFDLPENATLRALLGAVVQRFPKLAPLVWDESGQLFAHVHVFVNGHDSQYLPDGLATILTPSDKIDIFPPVAGG